MRWGRTAPNLCRLPDVWPLRQHHPGALAVLAFLHVDNPSILFESLFLRLVNVCNFFCHGTGLIAFCLVVVSPCEAFRSGLNTRSVLRFSDTPTRASMVLGHHPLRQGSGRSLAALTNQQRRGIARGRNPRISKFSSDINAGRRKSTASGRASGSGDAP